MNILRKYIRKLILEKGEFRKKFQAGHGNDPRFQSSNEENVNIKKWFHMNADQESLQKLVYVHWSELNNIFKILNTAKNGRSHSEINTLIFPKYEKLQQLDLDFGEGEQKIGLIVKGWVSLASNIDLDSGRMSNVTSKNPKLSSSEQDILKQQIAFGLNKRPSIDSIKSRITASIDGDRSPVLVGDEMILHPNDWEKALILKASDLKLQSDISAEVADMTLNWPEALIDNWKPIAIVIHSDEGSDDWFSLIDVIHKFKLPVIDENQELWIDIYEEYLNWNVEIIQELMDNDQEYELQDHEKIILNAYEDQNILMAFPYLKNFV